MKPTSGFHDLQWAKFYEHWGLLITNVAIIALTKAAMFLLFAPIAGMSLALFLMVTGALLIGRSKLPAYRAGQFFSWGLRCVPMNLTICYRRGWRVFLVGAAVMLIEIALLR